MERILAIDFETANSSRASACAIGYALIENGTITASGSYLINPQTHFDNINIGVHHIHPQDVSGHPQFPHIWQTHIAPLLTPTTYLLAHSAAFDMSVLRASCDRYGLTYPQHQYFCTYIMMRSLEVRESYRLNDLCAALAIALNHHDAGSDAFACAQVYQHLLKRHNVQTAKQLVHYAGYRFGELRGNTYQAHSKLKHR